MVKVIEKSNKLSFEDWLNKKYYDGFDPSGLSDEEYYELEDEYNKYLKRGNNTSKDIRESKYVDYELVKALRDDFASISEVCNDMVNAFYYDNYEDFTIDDIKNAIKFIKSKANSLDKNIDKVKII